MGEFHLCLFRVSSYLTPITYAPCSVLLWLSIRPLLTTSNSSTSYAKYTAVFSSSAICTEKNGGGGENRRCKMRTNNWKALVVEIIELLRLAQWISRVGFYDPWQNKLRFNILARFSVVGWWSKGNLSSFRWATVSLFQLPVDLSKLWSQCESALSEIRHELPLCFRNLLWWLTICVTPSSFYLLPTAIVSRFSGVEPASTRYSWNVNTCTCCRLLKKASGNPFSVLTNVVAFFLFLHSSRFERVWYWCRGYKKIYIRWRVFLLDRFSFFCI